MRRWLSLLMLVLGPCVDVPASAQDGGAKLGILGPAEEPRFSQMSEGLKRGLAEHGFSVPPEIIAAKVARGDRSAAQAAAAEFARQGAAAVFAIGSELARVVRDTAPEIPVVFVTPGDPVESGLVASLARPGGNMTAMTFEFPELSAKRLELLKELGPHIRRVLVIYDPRDASPRQGLAYARQAAPKLGITLIERETRSRADVDASLDAFGEADAFLAIPGGLASAHLPKIVRAAHSKRVITFLHTRSDATADAVASYGAKEDEIAREAARSVHKILTGEKAGDLPVVRPSKFEFVINLRTAKALGIAVPPTLLVRADEVIE